MTKPITIIVRGAHLTDAISQENYDAVMKYDKEAYAASMTLFALQSIYKAPNVYIDGNNQQKIDLRNEELNNPRSVERFGANLRDYAWFDAYRPSFGLDLGVFDTTRLSVMMLHLKAIGVSFEYKLSENEEIMERTRKRILDHRQLPASEQQQQSQQLSSLLNQDAAERDQWLFERILEDGAQLNIALFGFYHQMLPFQTIDRMLAFPITIYRSKEQDTFVAQGGFPVLDYSAGFIGKTLVDLLTRDPAIRVVPDISYFAI